MSAKTNTKGVAYAILRITMGLNLFGHGFARISKVSGFRDWMITEFKGTIIPQWLVYTWGSVLPFIEFIVGLLLVLGLFTYRVATVGATVIAILVLGSCLAEKWEWAGLQMVYALIFYFLVGNTDYNTCSLGFLLKKCDKK